MSDFPSLLSGHEYRFGFETNCSCDAPGIWSWRDYTEHIREARTIRTVEQLDALRADPAGCEGSIVKDCDGEIYESNDDGSWTVMGVVGSERIPSLPALLLWSPEWETPLAGTLSPRC